MAWYNTHLVQGFFWSWTNKAGHSGIDLAAAQGTPLTSPVAGSVLHAGWHPWGGQVDIVYSDHGQEYTMSFLHMSRIDVSAGRALKPGDGIGLSGGDNLPQKYSRGHHIHFEIWLGRGAAYIDYSPIRNPTTSHHPIDPTPFWKNLEQHGPGNLNDGTVVSGGTDTIVQALNPFPCPKPNWWPSNIPYPRNCNAQGDPTDSSLAPSDKQVYGPQRAHDVLQELPGFLGIVAALDDYETVTPFQPPEGLLNTPEVPGYVAGWVIGNTAAIFVRLMIATGGLILLVFLILAAVRKPVADALEIGAGVVGMQNSPIVQGVRGQASPINPGGASRQPTAPAPTVQNGPLPAQQAAPARVAPANAPTVPMRAVP